MMKKFCLALLVLALAASPVVADECAGPLSFYTVDPCRWLDTRVPGCVVGGGCWEGPFKDGQTRKYLVQGAAVCPATVRGSVPVGACAIVLNVVATQATGRGRLVLYNAYLWERPLVSSINFGVGQTTTNMVIAQLGQDPGPPAPILPDLAIYARVAGGGTVHVVVDMVGYFAPRED